MKIGNFANTNNISIDAVRHYMDLGLITPDKEGGQYAFNDDCQKSYDSIKALKSMGFTLHEIKTIFQYKLIGSLTHYQEDEYFKALFTNKRDEILKQTEVLKSAKKVLDDKIDELSSHHICKNFSVGVDLNTVSLLKCSKCGGSLAVSEASVEENQIIEGNLKCLCGQVYKISEGILFANDKTIQSPKASTFLSVSDYINNTDFEYLENLCKSLTFINNKIDFSMFEKKIVLELGTGSGFFLRNVLEKLPDDCVYFAVDYDIGRHKFLRHMLQCADIKKNIVLLCGDFSDLPLPQNSIDILVDYSGTSNYSFENEEFLLNITDNLIKRQSYLIGSYIVFKNFMSNGIIKDEYRKNFVLDNVKSSINKLGYEVQEERTSDFLESSGKYEDYFVEGEKVYNYILLGKRSG